MIVSASYRTDIPAFYAPWFLKRLAAGFCRVANPYGGADAEVSLRPGAVDGFVLWTRNIAPLAPHLEQVRARAPFVVQFTATGYPRALEGSVIDWERAAGQITALARDWGRRAVVWRYDPIVVSSLTPPAWHLANFARLAAALAGATDEVIVSFAAIYRKTRRNLDAAALAAPGFAWEDPAPEAKRDLLYRLATLAAERGMRLTLCTQPALLMPGIGEARCVDADRLSDVAQVPIAAPEKGNRPGCRCARSRDIGAYDSCPHGCVYCYAVSKRDRAVQRYRAHDPESEFLIAPPGRD
jgi:hypothetical protein